MLQAFLRRMLVLAIPGLLVALPACSQDSGGSDDGTKRIIFLTNVDDPFWDAARAGLQDAARELDLKSKGLRAELDKNSSATAKGQIDKLRQYANQTDVAAVAISVLEPNNVALADALRDLQKQGIKIITVDSDINRETARDLRFAYLGTDNVIGGIELGRAAKALRPEGGKYATFVGNKTQANAVERIEGFAKGAGDEFVQVENMGDDGDEPTADRNVKDALDRHADLSTLVGIWAYNAHHIAVNVKERGLRDKTTIVVFDAAEKAIRHMEEGSIDAMVVQNPYEMGYKSVVLLTALLEDDQKAIAEMFPAWDPEKKEFKEPDGDLHSTSLKVVKPDDDNRLTEDLFDPTTEVLTLSDFKGWLAKYNLKSS